MPAPFELHHLVKRGEAQRVRELLRTGEATNINAYDNRGYTPLMYAVESSGASVELVRFLLEEGASVHQECVKFGTRRPVVAVCLNGGDPGKLALLLDRGAEIHYQRGEGYGPLFDAVTGRDIARDPHLIDLLKLLVGRAAPLNGVTRYGESALRALSRVGRFDAVGLLLDAGADETQLAWTPLIRAVALGSVADMEKALDVGVYLEDRDWWSRTAYLVAVQAGDMVKARLLLERGADPNARGHCGTPGLFYAIENYHTPMLEWLLESGMRIEETDELSTTPLMAAAECGNAEAVEVLLRAGADVNRAEDRRTAINLVERGDVATRLLDAGADPAELSFEGRRSLLGFEPEPDEALLDVSHSDFHKGWSRRFGASNPEEIAEPFWEGMVRAGISAARAARLYGRHAGEAPVWCAQRFGQSLTFLPDGRIVQIGGEHEDFYDEDFCIYNDIFVHEPDGAIRIFGYPESIFPPIDFHTATLAGEHIYIVGSVGYSGKRQYGTTPVYRLNTRSFEVDRVETRGEAPGWISGHRAVLREADEICISGGIVLTRAGDDEICTRNERRFVLGTRRRVWRSL